MGNSSRKLDATKKPEMNAESFMHSQQEAEQHIAALAQLKERRRAELLAFEEQRAIQLSEEAQLNNSNKSMRNKFMNHVSESQKELENQIAQVHHEQEVSRTKFSEELSKSEAEMEKNISQVLKQTGIFRDQSQLLEMIKAEEQQVQNLMALKLEEYHKLRKAEILNAMKTQLEQDITSEKSNKSLVLKTHVVDDDVKNQQIEEILKHRQKDQAALVSSLLKEESWQCHAFKSLLSRRDRRSAQLSKDIRTVVDQLNQLTSWELQRKSTKQDLTTNTLAENRVQLAELLVQLIHQQETRRQDMKKLLDELEAQRQHQAEDYWLMQYQRLMENMPQSMHSVQDYAPSAPPLPPPPPPALTAPDDGFAPASAPPANDVFIESSCVICLDSSCHIIFLPCGHLCCCTKCGDSINQCPLCRASIAQRLQVHVS